MFLKLIFQVLAVASLFASTPLATNDVVCKSNKEQRINLFTGGIATLVSPLWSLSSTGFNCTFIIVPGDKSIVQYKATAKELALSQPTKGVCEGDKVTYSIPGIPQHLIPSLCGNEPVDRAIKDGELVQKDISEFTIIAFTKELPMARRFKIQFEPLFKGSEKLAPPGCLLYFTEKDAPIIFRSVNYPFGHPPLSLDTVVCFGSSNPKKPLKGVELIPAAISDERPFRMGSLKGAHHDNDCLDHDHVLLSGPRLNGKKLRYCGDRFNAAANSKVDGPVTFVTGGVYNVTIKSCRPSPPSKFAKTRAERAAEQNCPLNYFRFEVILMQ